MTHDNDITTSGADAGQLATRSNYLDWSHTHRSNPLLYLLAIVLGFVGWQIGSIPTMFLMSEDPARKSVEFLYTFILPALIILLLVRILLGRPGWTVAFASWQPRWRDWFIGVGVGWAVMLVLLGLILLLMPEFRLIHRGTDGLANGGIALVALIIGGYAIQMAFEEIYFRGLIMQALRRLTHLAPVVLLIQAYFFAQLHTTNLDVSGSILLKLLPYTFAALYLGWAAWRTGSLLMPMGLHFANNAW